MKRETFICESCGYLERRPGTGDYSAVPEHCRQPMKLLTDIQAYAAFHMNPEERVNWCVFGCRVLKGSKHKKWLPATNAHEVAESEKQESNHIGRKPDTYINEILEVLLELSKPCESANPEVVQLLKGMNVQDIIVNVLFVGSPKFRRDVYEHLASAGSAGVPRRYLTQFMEFIYNIIAFRDESIMDELEEQWRTLGLESNNVSLRSRVFGCYSEIRKKTFSLVGFLSQKNLFINDPET